MKSTWIALLFAIAGSLPLPALAQPAAKPSKADELLLVDCLLPGQIRRLGRQVSTWARAARARTSAASDDAAVR